MPWGERQLMSLRTEFVHLALAGELPMSVLCRRFGISRKTGYKWLGRFQADPLRGLHDRSRRPHHLSVQVPSSVIRRVIAMRQAHPRWGARKLRQRLVLAGVTPVPACSTITRLLHQAELIGTAGPPGQRPWQRFEHRAPNRLWQMDFKGAVPTCVQPLHPLTILDDHSRFNLCLQALPNQQTATVQAALIAVLRRYGLPNRLLVDNGAPWGDSGVQPYTRLTVWLLHVGIPVTHSRPYHPQTLGKDERFHGTLTREVLAGAQWDDGAQLQQALDRWRRVYNHVRPHDALALAVPASRYQPSLRPYPEVLPPLEYDQTVAVRRVQQKGTIHFRGYCLHVSKAFTGYPLGLRPVREDGQYEILFGPHRIQMVDLRKIMKTKV